MTAQTLCILLGILLAVSGVVIFLMYRAIVQRDDDLDRWYHAYASERLRQGDRS